MANKVSDEVENIIVSYFNGCGSVMETADAMSVYCSKTTVRRVLRDRGLYLPVYHKSGLPKPETKPVRPVPWDTLCDRYFASPVGSAIAQETLPVMLQRSRAGNYASVITVEDDE